MPVVPPSVPGSDRQQQEDYYAGLLDQYAAQHSVPAYNGNLAVFQGKSWGAIYLQIMADHPNLNPRTVADKVLGVEATAGLTHSMASADNLLGPFLTAGEQGAVKAARNASQLPGFGLLAGIDAIGAFFDKLGDPNVWLRVAEVAVGVILVAVAMNHLLGNPAGKAAAIAGKAV